MVMKSKLTRKILNIAIFISMLLFFLFTISIIIDEKTSNLVKVITSAIGIICIIGFIFIINITKAKPIVVKKDSFKILGKKQEFILRDIVKVDAYKRYMHRIENVIILKIYFKNNEEIVEIPINNYKRRDALFFLLALKDMNTTKTLSIKRKSCNWSIEFTDECKLIIGVYYNIELK